MEGFRKGAVTTGGVTLYYRHRPADGARLVMIPGSFLSADSLWPLISLLPKAWDILALELPGHCGGSPIMENASVEAYTEIALEAMRVLHRSDSFLFGHSIGGMMALHALGVCADLRGAILCEGWTHHSVKDTMEALGGNMYFTREAQALRLRELTASTAGWTEAQRTAFAQIWRRFDGVQTLAAAKVPVLELWGDRGIPKALTRDALQIPDRLNIELRLIANAGHYLPYFQTAECARAIRAFIPAS